MALPPNVDLVTVTGTYVGLDGTPASGTVTFSSSNKTWLNDATAPATLLPNPIVATLDEAGHFSVQVPATNDSDIQPNGWTYDVAENLHLGAVPYVRNYAIPAATGVDFDLAEVAPVSPIGGGGQRLVLTVNGKQPTVTGAVTLVAADIGAISQATADARYLGIGDVPAVPVTSVQGRTGDVSVTLTDIGGVPTSRQVIAGTGLEGGGALSADQTLSVAYGSTAGTAEEGSAAAALKSKLDTSYTHPLNPAVAVGVEPGVTLTAVNTASPPAGMYYDSGDNAIYISTPGTYSGLLFTNVRVGILASNVTLKNCKVTVDQAHATSSPAINCPAIYNSTWLRRRVVEHCEVTGWVASAVSGAGYTARFVYGHDLVEDFAHTDRSIEPTIIEWCVGKDFIPPDSAHGDAVQIVEPPMAEVIVRNNWLDCSNKPGYTYPNVEPDAGPTSGVYVQAGTMSTTTAAPDTAPRGKVTITDNYIACDQAFYAVRMYHPHDVPVEFARNRIKVPTDVQQGGGTGTAFDIVTPAHGYGNVDAAGNPISHPLITGQPPTLSAFTAQELTYGDKLETCNLADATAVTLTADTAYLVICRADRAYRAKKLRTFIDTLGTFTAAGVTVFRGPHWTKLSYVAYLNPWSPTATGLQDTALTVSDAHSPIVADPTPTDVLVDVGDYVAYLVCVTSTSGMKLLGKSGRADVVNRNGVKVAATKSMTPGAIPADINVNDGTWTPSGDVLWFALGGGFPE